MRQLLDLFNTSDAKSIIIEKYLDEDFEVDPDELVRASEDIIREWEKLKDSNFYENHLRDKEFYLYKICEMQALDTIRYAIDYGFTHHAEALIKEFRFRIKPEIKEVERKIKLLRNWFRLYQGKHPDNEETEVIVWEDLIGELEYQSEGRLTIKYDCTAIQYLSYEKIIKRISEARKRHVKED